MKDKNITTLICGVLCLGCAAIVLLSRGHKIPTPTDIKEVPKFHNQLISKTMDLQQDNLSLYVDYSLCNVLGQNSPVYNAIVPSLVAATKHYYSIKGDSIKKEPGQVFQLLRNIRNVHYADLQTAAERIAAGNTEAVLLTDGEFYQPNIARAHINDPYMASAFKIWLLKGHDIYFVIEPYIEPGNGGMTFNKKRFYIVFTDSRIAGNIWKRIVETANLANYPEVTTYHLSIDHPQLYTSGENHSRVNQSLAAEVKGFGNYEIQSWSVSWKDAVFPLVMSSTIDANGNPLRHGDYISKGISVDRNSLGGYAIKKVSATVYSINQTYADFVAKKGSKDTLQPIGGISIDSLEFVRHGNINLYFNEEFDEGMWLTGKPYNYTKVDIVVSEIADMFSQYENRFIFDSIDKPGMQNTSVAESIKQCMAYPEVQEKAANCLLYTFYIQSSEN